MTYKTSGKILWCLIVLVILFGVVFEAAPDIAYAAETLSYDTTDVLEDLSSSTVNGEPFDIRDYPYDDNSSVQIINFVEYCYSYKTNMQGNYGLYIYVYNPQGLNLSTGSKQNKIQMCIAWDASYNPQTYKKFTLEFCSKSTGEYANLFYKFKVQDSSYFLNLVNSNERRYDVSGIELLTHGDTNATEYGVGGTYLFTGYTAGYGPTADGENTLSCTVQNLETLELEVHHTYFRTNVSSLGANHYNEVNTVYFSVPERIFETYGSLQKIRAEWWEYKTKLALVTSNKEFYELFKEYTKQRATTSDNDISAYLFSGYSNKSSGSTIHDAYAWAYNIFPSHDSGVGWAQYVTVSNSCSMIPYAFYSPVTDSVDTIFDFLVSRQKVGDVTSNAVAEWIYNYSNSLGNGYIDCNGREISADLFESTADNGRTMGYNDQTIDLEDTFDLLSYDSNHTWWDKLWTYGFSWPATDGDYYNVSPIQILEADDLVDTNSIISQTLLVNEDDVQDLQAFYTAETLKGNKVVLFRFATTDYYCKNVGGGDRDSDIYFAEDDKVAYIAQETIFLDFDIIELTFSKDGAYHVIPVVSSPVDIINGFTAPSDELEWWKILLALLFLVLLIILLAPVLPYVIRFATWCITLPFKVIDKIADTASSRRKKHNNKDEHG